MPTALLPGHPRLGRQQRQDPHENANNVATLRASFAAANAAGQTHSYQVLYNPLTGAMQVARDGIFLGSWTDASPLACGGFLSLRTDGSTVQFDDIAVSEVVKYYYIGGQRVAMRRGGTLYYLHSDHLGSTSVASNSAGAEVGSSRVQYYPYGGTRSGGGGLLTEYRYTGQTRDASTGLMYYGARFYDPTLGMFLAPDTIVPGVLSPSKGSPGDPQSLNRYAYVNNNPLRYVDPTGYAPCTTEWCWKNRWYNAHGYFWNGNHWSDVGDPVFADEAIARDVLHEAGVSLIGSTWTFDWVSQIAFGVAKFGQRLSGGLTRLKNLLGGGARVRKGSCFGSACAPPPRGVPVVGPFEFVGNGHTVYLPSNWPLSQIATTIVHELAHVIDWQGHFSGRWPYAPITSYAAQDHIYNDRWEVWAEAVTVWVFGNNYKSSERPLNVDVGAQMTRIGELLNGWR